MKYDIYYSKHIPLLDFHNTDFAFYISICRIQINIRKFWRD